jgi:hypothetical protein
MVENPKIILGPTGDFPRGKIGPDNEGGLRIGIASNGDTVILNFGTPVAWVGFPKEQAIELAKTILRHAGVRRVKVVL